MKRLALIMCSVLILAVAFAAQGSLAGAKRTAAPPCATSGLVVWLDTQGNGAAGSVYYRLKLTNLSGRRCTLSGYPGVSAVGLHGHRLGSPAGRLPSRARRVLLAKGATASAVLQITEVGNFPRTCQQTTAAALKVYPPNQTRAKVVPFPFGACAHRGPIYLRVKAVR